MCVSKKITYSDWDVSYQFWYEVWPCLLHIFLFSCLRISSNSPQRTYHATDWESFWPLQTEPTWVKKTSKSEKIEHKEKRRREEYSSFSHLLFGLMTDISFAFFDEFNCKIVQLRKVIRSVSNLPRFVSHPMHSLHHMKLYNRESLSNQNKISLFFVSLCLNFCVEFVPQWLSQCTLDFLFQDSCHQSASNTNLPSSSHIQNWDSLLLHDQCVNIPSQEQKSYFLCYLCDSNIKIKTQIHNISNDGRKWKKWLRWVQEGTEWWLFLQFAADVEREFRVFLECCLLDQKRQYSLSIWLHHLFSLPTNNNNKQNFVRITTKNK